MKYLGLTGSVLGWLLQTVPIVGVDIEFYSQPSCTASGSNRLIARCRQIPDGGCCNVPFGTQPRAVYAGTFLDPPGGIASWYWVNQRDPTASACSGDLKDSAGGADGESVCMMDQGSVSQMFGGGMNNGGAAWFKMDDIIQKSQALQRDSAANIIQPQRGFMNTHFIGHGISRRGHSMKARDDKTNDDTAASQPVSWDAWKELVDNTTEYQCNGNTHYADIFGWEKNSNGVWVLENPSKEQVEKLGSFAPAESQNAVNEYLKEVGATHYDDYKFDSEGIELEENVNGMCSSREALSGATYR